MALFTLHKPATLSTLSPSSRHQCLSIAQSPRGKKIMVCVCSIGEMECFPHLRDATERIVTERIKERQSNARDKISLLVDIQLAYVNTNHEDFIGFASAEQQSSDVNKVKLGNRSLRCMKEENKDQEALRLQVMKGNDHIASCPPNPTRSDSDRWLHSLVYPMVTQLPFRLSHWSTPRTGVIRRGWLGLQNVALIRGGSKDFWFVLNAETLTWYKDDDEKEKRYVLLLDGLKVKDVESSFFGRKNIFALFYPDGRNVYKDYKQLELSAESAEMVDSWKASFMRAGVQPMKPVQQQQQEKLEEQSDNGDPQLQRQIEVIHNLVDSYLKIVHKTQRDLVPKMIMYIIVNEMKEFLKSELLPNLYQAGDIQVLMSESLEMQTRREETLRMYEALKEALRIVGEVTTSTVSTPMPPPVMDDWMHNTASHSVDKDNDNYKSRGAVVNGHVYFVSGHEIYAQCAFSYVNGYRERLPCQMTTARFPSNKRLNRGDNDVLSALWKISACRSTEVASRGQVCRCRHNKFTTETMGKSIMVQLELYTLGGGGDPSSSSSSLFPNPSGSVGGATMQPPRSPGGTRRPPPQPPGAPQRPNASTNRSNAPPGTGTLPSPLIPQPFPPRSAPSVPNGLPNGGMRNNSVISNGIHSQFPSFENWFDEASLSRMSHHKNIPRVNNPAPRIPERPNTGSRL
ncbi:hypothetical protein ACTXT7_003469 [Hymenolepis weldensis]